MLLVPSKAFNHCILTLKSCKEPIFWGGGGGDHFWQEIVYMCSAPLHSVCHHLWLLSTLCSDLPCKTLTSPVWSKCGPISTSDANAAAESNVMMNSHYQWMPSLPLSTGPCLVRERLSSVAPFQSMCQTFLYLYATFITPLRWYPV